MVVFGVKCPPGETTTASPTQVTDITLGGVSIEADPSVFNRGQGMMVVSGTTDTFLPKSVAEGFNDAWEAATGSVSLPSPGSGLFGVMRFIPPPPPPHHSWFG